MKQVMKNKFSNIFYIFIATFLINSCSALSPYKVPILQGNIFEEEDIEKPVSYTHLTLPTRLLV